MPQITVNQVTAKKKSLRKARHQLAPILSLPARDVLQHPKHIRSGSFNAMPNKNIARLRIFAWYWLPVYLYMGLIYSLSSQSEPSVPSFLLLNDKITHFFEYALLGLLLIRAMKKEYLKPSLTTLKLIALLVAALYGASDELHQGFTSGREADFSDWLVDFCGSAFGSFCAYSRFWPWEAKKALTP